MERIRAYRLSEIPVETLRWLWKPYLPRGKLVLLDGDPGLGKSLVALDVAARLGRAADWPNGEPGDSPGATIFLNAEDAAADTVRPRAEAAGADLDRLVVVDRIDDRAPRLPDDVPALDELVREHAAALVVIDPILAFLPPSVAANSDQCVRRALGRLAELAARTGAAVVLVRHLNKRASAPALHRGTGSTGIIAAARAGLLVAPHPLDPSLRILSVTKTNLADPPPSLGFRIRSDALGRPVLDWLGPQAFTANQICRPETASVPVTPRDRAVIWLTAELAHGPRPATELYEAAARAGIPDRTLERAKKELRVQSHRVPRGKVTVSYWSDPSAAWPKDAPIKEPSRLPELEEL